MVYIQVSPAPAIPENDGPACVTPEPRDMTDVDKTVTLVTMVIWFSLNMNYR